MSCIVGISKGGVVYIGADSIATAGNEMRTRGDPKLFRNGKYLIGYSGAVRPGQVLHPRFWTPPDNIYDFTDAMRHQLEERGCMKKGEGGVDEMDVNLIIGVEGNLYEIQSDLQLAEYGPDNYTSIGAGSAYALGSLYETKDLDIHPKLRIQRSIDAAKYFCPAVGGEILILQNP